MNAINQIKALFFFSIISIMMLHNALPHVHHSHGTESEVSVHSEDHHHSRNHDNHHSDEHNSESEEQNFLLFLLLNNHSHLFQMHEFVALANCVTQPLQDKTFHVDALIENYGFSRQNAKQNLYGQPLFKPVFYDNPLLLGCSLRAPPSLG